MAPEVCRIKVRPVGSGWSGERTRREKADAAERLDSLEGCPNRRSGVKLPTIGRYSAGRESRQEPIGPRLSERCPGAPARNGIRRGREIAALGGSRDGHLPWLANVHSRSPMRVMPGGLTLIESVLAQQQSLPRFLSRRGATPGSGSAREWRTQTEKSFESIGRRQFGQRRPGATCGVSHG